MTHTPGPWTDPRVYRNPDNHIAQIVIYGGGGKVPAAVGTRAVCRVCPDTDEHMANARLIAAAPDLLAELERMEQAALCMADPEHCLHATRDHLPWKALVVKARIAIAKAKGEQA